MKRITVLVAGFLAVTSLHAAAEDVVPLPGNVKAVWDLDRAYREATPTRERVCINGLWRWQPVRDGGEIKVPEGGWGHFKVPGCWPGITDYIQKDCQTLYPHPDWAQARLSEIRSAWHQRQITIPPEWAGRRVLVCAEYLNSHAVVFVDDRKAGSMRFPAGEVDVTAMCPPGSSHLLSLHVTALPLKAVMTSFGDTAAERQVEGSVERRGLCGDVYLVSRPAAARIEDVMIDTSVRQGTVTFTAAMRDLRGGARYTLRAEIADRGRTVATFNRLFTADELRDGHLTFAEKWNPERVWDIHTPGNQLQATLSLLDAGEQSPRRHPPEVLRLPRALDRRPRLLPERHADFPLRPAAGQRAGRRRVGELRGRQGKPAAAQRHRHQLRLHAQLRLRAGHAPGLHGGPPGVRRRRHAGRALAASLRPVRLAGCRC